MKVREIVLTAAMSAFLLGLAARPANAQEAESVADDSASATEISGPQQQTPEELRQLVAPIALYPDALVAQVLAGAGYPTEIVLADRFLQGNTDTDAQKRAQEVNETDWDPSVKALTQFPSVLQNMDKNLSWTSQLGEAYTTQPDDVMAAVQYMRQQAQTAGNLTSNTQQTVTSQDSTIVIQPASTDVVYVPAYNPWAIYGYPIDAYPGWVTVPGIFYAGPTVYWGYGWGVGYYGGYGWGWNHWGYNWGGRNIVYNHNVYVNTSHTFTNNNNWHSSTWNNNNGNNHAGYSPNNNWHGGAGQPTGFHPTPGTPNNGNLRVGGSPSPVIAPAGNNGLGRSSGWGGGMHSDAFSGFNRGGNVGGFSSRGAGSFGGGRVGGGVRR